jgi:penicillin-binding protein 2
MIALIIVVGLAVVLLWRLYELQIVDYAHYQTLSDKNRMTLQSIVPDRGLIYDREGVLLADNQPIFSLTLVKEQVPDLDKTIHLIQTLIDVSDDDIDQFKKRLSERLRPYQPVVLKSRLTEKEIAVLAVNRYRLKGVDVEAELIRHYPFGASMAHALGYVGRINLKELKKLDPVNYSGTNYIGKLGVERFYEPELHGKVGYQTVETNARGRVMRVLDRTPPVPGRNLTLTLDADLQNYGMSIMAGHRGAIVAIEPKTGDILALVSTPSFDPNLFVTGIGHKSYAKLRDSIDIPLFNRALKGQYPPGSTIKPVIGLLGLDSQTITRKFTIFDPGYYQLENDKRLYRDWKRTGHGIVDLRKAITQSCDTFFYSLAFKLGVDRISPFLEKFGLGKNTTVDINEERKGLLPSRPWKERVRRLPWFPGDTLNMGIGQGYTLVTPLQLATMTAVLANKGVWHRPHLLKYISGKGSVHKRFENNPPDIKLNNPDNWNYMFSAMENVMYGRHGTARRSAIGAPYKIAGKTGTAQVVGIKQGEKYDKEALAIRHRDHALFIGFAPVDDPKIAVAVIVENGGGSHLAAPMARKMFDRWLLRPHHEVKRAK